MNQFQYHFSTLRDRDAYTRSMSCSKDRDRCVCTSESDKWWKSLYSLHLSVYHRHRVRIWRYRMLIRRLAIGSLDWNGGFVHELKRQAAQSGNLVEFSSPSELYLLTKLSRLCCKKHAIKYPPWNIRNVNEKRWTIVRTHARPWSQDNSDKRNEITTSLTSIYAQD